MFELPEIEVIKNELSMLEGLKVVFNTCFDNLGGQLIDRVDRLGLYICMHFDNKVLLIKPRGSGIYAIESGIEPIDTELCHWLIHLNNGMQLRYLDANSSPNIWIKDSMSECIKIAGVKSLNDPFNINYESFILRCRQYDDKSIRQVLINNEVICGVGKMYSLEACYEAFMNPNNLVRDLTDKQLINILICLRRILNNSISNYGINLYNFKGKDAKKKLNKTILKAYRQYICNRCNIPIIRGKSNTYYCELCQRILGGNKSD